MSEKVEGHAATTVFGLIVGKIMRAVRDNDRPEVNRLFDFSELFRKEFPAECQAWEDQWGPKSALPLEPVAGHE